MKLLGKKLIFGLASLALVFPQTLFASYQNTLINLEHITIANVNSLAQLDTFTSTNNSILDITFTEKSDALLLVTQDGKVQRWNIETNLTDLVLNIDHPIFASFNANGTKLPANVVMALRLLIYRCTR